MGTRAGKYKIGARAGKYKFGARAGKNKLGTRAGKYKLRARVGKHKLGTRAGKYKFGARAGSRGRGLGPGLVAKQRAWVREMQILYVKHLKKKTTDSEKLTKTTKIHLMSKQKKVKNNLLKSYR